MSGAHVHIVASRNSASFGGIAHDCNAVSFNVAEKNRDAVKRIQSATTLARQVSENRYLSIHRQCDFTVNSDGEGASFGVDAVGNVQNRTFARAPLEIGTADAMRAGSGWPAGGMTVVP